jgi:DNA anti-recombination protein RmuC
MKTKNIKINLEEIKKDNEKLYKKHKNIIDILNKINKKGDA